MFGHQGVMANSIDEYELREQQLAMSEAVLSALNADDILIVEAPTGTGKTLAYLVAAIL
ncbi:MAG: DEAD/DEAH box helicase family protein, partial [Pseudomonadota bacterium]